MLGIDVVNRAKWCQCSILTWIKACEANTKLFHLRASDRRQKNYIPTLIDINAWKSMTGLLKLPSSCNTSRKVWEFYPESLFAGLGSAKLTCSWSESLDVDFTMDEWTCGVHSLHTKRAPGPYGFIALFYKREWDTLKHDLMKAINQMHSLCGDHWNLLNSANIVLIQKKMALALHLTSGQLVQGISWPRFWANYLRIGCPELNGFIWIDWKFTPPKKVP